MAAITFLVFLPSLGNQFVNWDDTVNFVKNPNYRGLGWSNLRWMATTSLMGQWIPLTWLTLAIDYVIWGLNPFGYHLTNTLFHCATAVAWYFVARRLLALSMPSLSRDAATVGASAAALFFAVHPLRAESVAWVTERRDVVSGLFFMLTVLAYLLARSGETYSRSWLRTSVAFYALAGLSKSIVVSLPLVLLLLDVYPLRRFHRGLGRASALIPLIAEKAPYFAIAAFTGLMAFWAQRTNNFLTSLETLPLLDRVPVVLYSLWFYLWKTIAPANLSPLYELPIKVSFLDPRFLGPAVAILLFAASLLTLRRRWPAGAIAAAIYAVMLAPVSGAVHNGHQLVHDRYSYLPCLPWALLFGAGVAFMMQTARRGVIRASIAKLALVTAAAWLLSLGTLAAQQATVWRDDDTLWRFALEGDPSCSICYANLGVALSERGLIELAIPQFERSIALRPDRVRIRGNLGVALMRMGRPADALVEFQKVRARYPDDLNNRNNIAAALMRLGHREEAMAELRGILDRDPQSVLARTNLALGLIESRQVDQAVPILEAVIADQPDEVAARIGLVRGYLLQGRPGEARQALDGLRRVDRRTADVVEGLFITAW
ncbi:MAG TPA: tetratricopeptide repeat protein [Gemmatimonadales bacterium]|nr:tetratricopeptide repeat protein [Gemmatimonadales bacterium]